MFKVDMVSMLPFPLSIFIIIQSRVESVIMYSGRPCLNVQSRQVSSKEPIILPDCSHLEWLDPYWPDIYGA